MCGNSAVPKTRNQFLRNGFCNSDMAASIKALSASRSSRQANLWGKVTCVMALSLGPPERFTSSGIHIRVNLDLWYAVPPTKGGHRYGNVTVRRSPDPPDRGPRFDQSH